jgi:hypothetical protein
MCQLIVKLEIFREKNFNFNENDFEQSKRESFTYRRKICEFFKKHL